MSRKKKASLEEKAQSLVNLVVLSVDDFHTKLEDIVIKSLITDFAEYTESEIHSVNNESFQELVEIAKDKGVIFRQPIIDQEKFIKALSKSLKPSV